MRLLYVVQRYGDEVAGGAEAHCRLFAERLVERGHQVSVLTSCARDYDTWDDYFPAGTETVQGVTVHRLRVATTRDTARFDALSQRVVGTDPPSAVLQDSWMYEQGPTLQDFGATLRRLAGEVDLVIFFTYLYATTAVGLRELDGIAPALLHPTVHDEWPARLSLIRSVFDRADGFAVSTPEELALVRQRFRPTGAAAVIGIGFEAPQREPGRDVEAFRQRFGLEHNDYVVCVGRIDPNKGTPEAISFMQAFERRHDGAPTLVLCGAEMMEIVDRTGLVVTGFVDDATKWAALAGSVAVIQPSRQESFAMTLAEAWLAERPVLVQEACDVTAGLTRRSGGGLVYSGYSSFDATLELLLDRPDLAWALGLAGKDHVEAEFAWDMVLERYEQLIDQVLSSARRPTTA